MDSGNLILELEKINEGGLSRLIRSILPKIEAFANILGIDINEKNGLKQVLINAVYLSSSWHNAEKDLHKEIINEQCKDTLTKVADSTITNIQTAFFLANDIVLEILAKLKDAIFTGGD